MSLENDLKDLVSENLPEQTANAMREFIDEAEETKRLLGIADKEIVAFTEKRARLQEENLLLNADLEKHGALDTRAEALDAREKEIQDREDRQNMASMSLELTLVRAHVATVECLVEKVFGHPGVTISNTRSVTNNSNRPVTDQYNNQTTEFSSEDETETEITSHTKT